MPHFGESRKHRWRPGFRKLLADSPFESSVRSQIGISRVSFPFQNSTSDANLTSLLFEGPALGNSPKPRQKMLRTAIGSH